MRRRHDKLTSCARWTRCGAQALVRQLGGRLSSVTALRVQRFGHELRRGRDRLVLSRSSGSTKSRLATLRGGTGVVHWNLSRAVGRSIVVAKEFLSFLEK